MKSMPFAVNPDTMEVHERTPDKLWKSRLDAWIKARRARRHEYTACAIPCPGIWGHTMFMPTKGNFYKPMASAPTPIWTSADGLECLYEGQRVGWESSSYLNNGDHWQYGRVLRMEGKLLAVQRDNDKIVFLDPENLA